MLESWCVIKKKKRKKGQPGVLGWQSEEDGTAFNEKSDI